VSILAILRAQPTLLDEKSVKLLISIAGNGKLTDGSTTCAEFRELLAAVPAERRVQYADECLKERSQDSDLITMNNSLSPHVKQATLSALYEYILITLHVAMYVGIEAHYTDHYCHLGTCESSHAP